MPRIEPPRADGPVNILIVDDQPANLLALEAILSAPGYKLVTVASGAEALRSLLADEFAVVLLDIQMQGLDGFETARLIRRREKSRHTPLIFITAHESTDFPIREAYQLGAVDYLIKPIVPEILQAKVAGFVELYLLRRRAEQAERARREQLRVTLTTIGDAVITTDEHGQVTFINPAARVLTGWSIADAVGAPVQEVLRLLDETTRQPLANPLAAFTGPGPAALPDGIILLSRDGSERLIAETGGPVRSDQGELLGTVLVFRDVTRKRQAERRLLAQHATAELLAEAQSLIDVMPRLLQALAETLGWEVGVYWQTDAAAGHIHCMALWHAAGIDIAEFESTCRGTSFARGAGLPGRVWADGAVHWIPDVVRDANFPRAAMAARQGLHAGCGFPIRLGKHVLGVLEFFSRHVRPPDPELIQTMETIGRQIGQYVERQTAEADRAESERRYRFLADAVPAFVFTARPDGVTDYVNQRWVQYTELSGADSVGAGWAAAIHPDDRERTNAAWQEAIQSGGPFRIEYRIVRTKEGTHRWFVGQALPRRDEQGRIAQWVGTCMDIDEQKRAEQALQDADRRKDEFLAMLAHELRNPLAPIRNGLHILRLRGHDPATVEQAREMMDRQAQHLSRLVDDLLDVSRITRGKIALQLDRIDLGRLAVQCATDHHDAFAARQLRLNLEVPQQPVWVRGDATRLAQILDNLLGNARKFTDPGGAVTLQLTTDNQQATLRVRDTGIGIDPAMLPRLFDIFAQAEQGLDRSSGGLGLGLAIVKGLAELHGGAIQAASAGKGRGAEFSLTLPLAAAPADDRAAPPSTPLANKRLRVLVIEDNTDAAQSLRMLLELFGHVASVAETGPEGIEAVRRERPDVILCDVGLPGMDGFAVARTLRADPATRDIRLIALTGYGRAEDRDQALAAGFDEHLTKPIDPERLLAYFDAAHARP